MFQYDATVSGGHGGGGEYEVQQGFGWTNGIIMELLEMFGDRLTAEERFTSPSIPVPIPGDDVSKGHQQLSAMAQVLTVLLAVIATLIAGCIG